MERIKKFDLVSLRLDDGVVYQVLGYEVYGKNKRWLVTNGEEMVYKFREELIKIPEKKAKQIGFGTK